MQQWGTRLGMEDLINFMRALTVGLGASGPFLVERHV